MKKKVLMAAALMIAITVTTQKANAQAWSLIGNNNAADTSKLGTRNYKPLRVYTNDIERLRIDVGGLVGIGTTTPGALLHVSRGVNNAEIIRMTAASLAYASVYEGGNMRGYWGSYSGSAADVDLGTAEVNSTGKVHLTIMAVPKFTIDATGNAGIGTTTPTAKLHVAGNVKINSTNTIEFGSGITKEVNAGKIGYATFTTGSLDIVGAGTSTTNRKIKFWNEGGAEFTGNVLMGTSTAATGYRLSVGGKIMCEELKVLLRASWPDYVFKQDYEMMNLSELDNYIKKNNHLPGIKPAAEIEKEGVEIGEMQRIMMQKIEELTLYVIELKKENESLKTMITAGVK